MIELFLIFWTVMIFTSIFWYGFLLFYVGAKGAREIRVLTQTLGRRDELEKKAEKNVR